MSGSPWGWVTNMELPYMQSVEVRDKLKYLAAITVMVQISVDEAETLFNKVLHDRARNEDNTSADSEDDWALFLLGLLVPGIAGAAAWAVSEFLAVAYGSMMMTVIRRRTWQTKFSESRFLDPAISQTSRAEWEQYAKKAYARVHKKNKVISSMKEGSVGKLSETLAKDAVTLLLDGVDWETGDTNQPDPGRVAGVNATQYWNTLQYPASRMQDLLEEYAKSVRWLEQHGVPVLDPDMTFIMRAGENLLPTTGGMPTTSGSAPGDDWLKDELATILNPGKHQSQDPDEDQARPWVELPKTRLEKLANERLSHIWLIHYIALYETPMPKIDGDHFNATGSPNNMLIPFHRPPYQSRIFPQTYKEIPALVFDQAPRLWPLEWATGKVIWRHGEKAMATALVDNVKQGPRFEETYRSIAVREIFTYKPPADFSGPLRVAYHPPGLDEAQIEHAYRLLTWDIYEHRTKGLTTAIRNLVNGPLASVYDMFWRSFGMASTPTSLRSPHP